MNQKKAVRVAVRAMEYRIKRLAQQANLWDIHKLDNVHCINASQERRELREAIEVLKEMVE